MSTGYLVTGCGRSGTGYTAALLRRLGLDVGHEKVGRDGLVSWYAASIPRTGFVPPHLNDWQAAIPGWDTIKVAHLVRHPLNCIASCQTHTRGAWRHVGYLIPGIEMYGLVERGMWMWEGWNAVAETIADTRFCVESISEDFGGFCEFFGVVPNCDSLGDLPTNSRAGQYRPLDWDDLERVDEGLTALIRTRAQGYGYWS